MAKAKLGKALATKLKDFIDEMKDKYAMTPDQTKSAIRNYANEGYLPKDPKRILPGDDERLALMISTNTMVPGRKAEFMQDILEVTCISLGRQIDAVASARGWCEALSIHLFKICLHAKADLNRLRFICRITAILSRCLV